GLAARVGAPSLLRGRTRDFLWLCGVSVVLWTLFEGVNLRLGNWYYVMDHPSRAARWVGGVVAFATVIPAILATESALSKVRWLGHVPMPRLRWSRGGDGLCLALGAACVLLP